MDLQTVEYSMVFSFHFCVGGSAEKNGRLRAGDELLSVNGSDVTILSRIEAWGLMKRLPDGPVALAVRHRLNK